MRLPEQFASSPAVRRKMQAQPSRDTAPELALRSVLHARGLRYFVHRRPLPGLNRQADIVFPGVRVAVFVDGCFWHGCPRHANMPVNNADFWHKKLATNRQRDREVTLDLRGLNWRVIRIWEHDLVSSPVRCVRRILTSLGRY